jgi:hypothetical protein
MEVRMNFITSTAVDQILNYYIQMEQVLVLQVLQGLQDLQVLLGFQALQGLQGL